MSIHSSTKASLGYTNLSMLTNNTCILALASDERRAFSTKIRNINPLHGDGTL